MTRCGVRSGLWIIIIYLFCMYMYLSIQTYWNDNSDIVSITTYSAFQSCQDLQFAWWIFNRTVWMEYKYLNPASKNVALENIMQSLLTVTRLIAYPHTCSNSFFTNARVGSLAPTVCTSGSSESSGPSAPSAAPSSIPSSLALFRMKPSSPVSAVSRSCASSKPGSMSAFSATRATTSPTSSKQHTATIATPKVLRKKIIPERFKLTDQARQILAGKHFKTSLHPGLSRPVGSLSSFSTPHENWVHVL